MSRGFSLRHAQTVGDFGLTIQNTDSPAGNPLNDYMLRMQLPIDNRCRRVLAYHAAQHVTDRS